MEQEKDTVRKRHRVGEENKKNDDSMLTVMIVQTIVCAAVILVSLLIMKNGGELFENLKSELSYIMGKDITISEAAQAFKEFRDFIFPEEETQTENGGNPEETESDTEAQITGAGGESTAVIPSNSSVAPFTVTVKAVCPVKGTITSPYGFRKDPFTGKPGFHSGLDIGAPEGENIAAAFYGKVIKTGTDDEYGNYVIISHCDGFSTLYALCSEVYVKENTVIRAGETIAAVGSTGLSTGPHLHFEIRRDGVRYNPSFVLGDFFDDL